LGNISSSAIESGTVQVGLATSRKIGEASCGVSLPGWPVTTGRTSATRPSRQ
jgi:hypothetical protein